MEYRAYNEQEMIENMRRVYAKLVKHGYARPVVWGDTRADMPVLLTEAGKRLRDDVRQIFDYPKTPLKSNGRDEPAAFWLLLLVSPDPPV